MNKIIILLALSLVIVTNAMGQWEVLNRGMKGNVKSIDFINENVGFIAGESTLLKTMDGGDSWQAICDSLNFKKIDFLNDTLGWAIDAAHNSGDIIIKTTDGGYTWDVQNDENIVFKDIFVANDSVVFATGLLWAYPFNDGRILKTEDGGSTWTNIMPGLNKEAFSINFTDNDNGIAAGRTPPSSYILSGKGLILKTNDGGENWTSNILNQNGPIILMQIINDSTGFFIAGDTIFATTDFFNSWTIRYINNFPISSLYCFNESIIYALMEDSLRYINVMKSSDGGFTWENKFIFTLGNDNNIIYFKDPDEGFLFTNNYARLSIWKTENSNSWTNHLLSFPFSEIFFIDNNLGFVGVGSNIFTSIGAGGFFSTINGGISWNHIDDISNGNVFASSFYNNNGLVIQHHYHHSNDDFKISRTTDAGQSWDNVFFNSLDFMGSDIYLLNDQLGWCVGAGTRDTTSGPAVLSTIDGGENWDITWVGTKGHSLYSVHGINNTFWASGDSGLVIKSISVDSVKVLTPFTDLNLSDIYFCHEYHGWISGWKWDTNFDIYRKIFRTVDGGTNWQDIAFFDYQVNDMYFADSLRGWIVGSDTSDHGILLETNNGGFNWVAIFDDLPGPLQSLHFKGNYGWAAGDFGLVLKTDDGGASWIADNNTRAIPNDYQLLQNYPNPFNPRTNIEFSIHKSEFVTLKVYNILGEEVARLVSEKLPAGSYKYNWDASSLASGVYLYRIQAGNYVEAKKMILMR